MKLLLDTHLLLWSAGEPNRLPAAARTAIEEPDNQLLFSAASVWEVAIKSGLGRADFTLDPRLLRRSLVDNGYEELDITGAHAASVVSLPPIHKDPFDRLLIAQAIEEGVTLMTVDEAIAQYEGPIRRF